MKKDIVNINDKGQYHGYQECYHYDSELWSRCNFKNGQAVRYAELHGTKQTFYIIK